MNIKSINKDREADSGRERERKNEQDRASLWFKTTQKMYKKKTQKSANS